MKARTKAEVTRPVTGWNNEDGAPEFPAALDYDGPAGCPTAQAGGKATVAVVRSPDDPQLARPWPFGFARR